MFLQMKKQNFTFFLWLGLVILMSYGSACRAIKVTKNKPFYLNKDKSIVLCDSLRAAELIGIDETDDIFGKMTVTEMCIQMKRNYSDDYTSGDIVSDYLTFVKKDVTNFNPSETEFVAAVMKECFDLCNKVSPNIYPKNINLIKTKGKYYGDGVYFTREDCIIIPANELKTPNKERFMTTMLHEIFHVYSRKNPEKRAALYQLIGFRAVEPASNVVIPEPLKSRILLNPDGTNFLYYINLQVAPDKEIKAIPIIYANADKYNAKKPAFFNYLVFELFELQPIARGWKIQTTKEGHSTLNLKELPDFFRQIRNNTDYIIHPDEVLADNFSFLVLEGKDKNRNEKFSKEGKELLQMIAVELKK
jgi:hypothetical protein